jgi:hypothetical protein
MRPVAWVQRSMTSWLGHTSSSLIAHTDVRGGYLRPPEGDGRIPVIARWFGTTSLGRQSEVGPLPASIVTLAHEKQRSDCAR